jgi:hypothetical protein
MMVAMKREVADLPLLCAAAESFLRESCWLQHRLEDHTIEIELPCNMAISPSKVAL